MVLKGHTDTLTGMRVSPDGSHLLTNAMDGTLRVWDMRPYAPQNRCVKVFNGEGTNLWKQRCKDREIIHLSLCPSSPPAGHQHTFERLLLRCDWSPDGTQVTAGSSDRNVYIWDASTRKLLYKLPGHNGSVNEAVFHPKEPIIGSCSSDKTIFLGELM